MAACDILILGGGSAGIAATVSAASVGAETILIEKNDYLGGMATSAWVGTICGLHYRSVENLTWCCEGFPLDFVEQVAHASNTQPEQGKNGLWYLPYSVGAFKNICRTAVHTCKAQTFFSTEIVNIIYENNRWTVKISRNGITKLITTKALVDCSGSATALEFLDSSYLFPQQPQAQAIVFELAHLPDIETSHLRFALLSETQKGIINGVLSKTWEKISVVPGSHRDDGVLLKLGLPRSESEPQVKREDAATSIVNFVNLLQSGNSVLKTAILREIAPCVGIRSNTRLEGIAKLCRDDVIACKKFSTGIASGVWPIEEWLDHREPKMTYMPELKGYEIPAECLQSQRYSTLFAAGKNISSDDGAIASARVIGTCLQTGYAAGILAAHSLEETSLDQSVKKIRSHLCLH